MLHFPFQRPRRVKVAFVCGYGDGSAVLYTAKFEKALKAYGLDKHVKAVWRGTSHNPASGEPLPPQQFRKMGVQGFDYAVFRLPAAPKLF